MSRLCLHRTEVADVPPSNGQVAEVLPAEAGRHQATPGAPLAPLLIDITGLAALLARSVPSLHRDDAAGRLPAALRIGGSKRWRYAEIVEWVELGCPSRSEFEVLHRGRR